MLEFKKSVTIKDVAKLAGVSTATVSHVVNKSRYVSDKVTADVNCAIEELGYYPNQLVSGLRKNKSYAIGLIIPSISNESLGLLAERIQRKLFLNGYNLIICNTSYDTNLETRALETLIMKKVDAVIAIPTTSRCEKLIEISKRGVPVLLVDRHIDNYDFSSITVDNHRGAWMMAEHLIKQGHREIGYIDRKVSQSHSREQTCGFLAAMEHHGLCCDYIVSANGYDYASGYAAAQALLQARPSITAVFGYYDVIALGAVRGLLDMGYRVPEDISVVGYDAMPITRYVSPLLTTVEFPVSRLSALVCEHVLAMIADKEKKYKVNIVLDTQLILGESVAPPTTSFVKNAKEG